MRKTMTSLGFFSIVIFSVALLIITSKNSIAMSSANGTGVAWGTSDGNTFVSSVTSSAFGRSANQIDYRNFEQVNRTKFPYFMNVIGSQEYNQRFGNLSRNYHVYFNVKWNQNMSSMCNCYYFANNNRNAGLMPAMQYTGVSLPPYPLNFPVARALTEMCWTFDRNSCDAYDCGKPEPVSSERVELNRYCNEITKKLQAARERGDINTYRSLLEGYGQCDFYNQAVEFLDNFSRPINPEPWSGPATPQRNEKCDSTSKEGSNSSETIRVNLGNQGGNFDVKYNMKTIKDRMQVSLNGQHVWDTGCKSHTGSKTFYAPSGMNNTVLIKVLPRCEGDKDKTKWYLTVTCPK